MLPFSAAGAAITSVARLAWDPAWLHSSLTLSDANTAVARTGVGAGNTRATIPRTTGKWAFEGIITNAGATGLISICTALPTTSHAPNAGGGAFLTYTPATGGIGHESFGYPSVATSTIGDLIMMAYDGDADTVKLYKNGTQIGGDYEAAGGTYYPTFYASANAPGLQLREPLALPSGYLDWGTT